MTKKIIPCKYCKRGRIKVHKTNAIGSQIIADKCIYCNGRGWIRIDNSNLNKLEDIKKYNDNKEKGGKEKQ